MGVVFTHSPTDDDDRGLPLVYGLLLFIPLSLVGSAISVVLKYPDIGTAILFPSYAALTAALIASPRRHWIWYITAGVITHAALSLTHWSLSWVFFSDVANVTRAVLAAVLLVRFLGPRPRLDTVPSLLVFIGVAAIFAPAVAATIGAANVVLQGASPTFARPWFAWFLSNALTALTMLPLFLVAIGRGQFWRRRADPARVVEAVVVMATLLSACYFVYLSHFAELWHLALPLYGPLPLLIWMALRFGPGGASIALTSVAIAATVSAGRGNRVFGLGSPNESLLTLQVFLLLTTMPVLCIGVVASGRHRAVQLYRALLASLQDHVAILDARGHVLEVNESWRRYADSLSPCPFERAQSGTNFLAACRDAVEQLERLHPERNGGPAARALAGVGAVLAGERRRFEMEYEQEHDGTREWFTMRAEALERAAGGAVVTRANVSERHRVQMEMEEQRRELSHLARVAVLGQLSGAFAHELRQPLSSIMANAEAAKHLLHHAPVDLEEMRTILQDIVDEDKRAAQVIDSLRTMLKRGDSRMQPVDSGDLVHEVLNLARAELITRHVTAHAQVDHNIHPVFADRVQVQQVLLNLILNACEAMSSTVADDRSLSFTASSDGSDVHFSIRDTGEGIDPALIDRLFEPFVTTKSEGLGLGLSISRAIVAAHGGRIWAENNPTRGATVHCVIPSAPVASAIDTPLHNSVNAPAFQP